MALFLLDTNTCIAIMNNFPPNARQQLMKKSVTDVGISVISLYELQYGVSKSTKVEHNTNTLNSFLEYIQVFDWTKDCAYITGKLRADLEKTGDLIGPYDMQIAAHALVLKATLVTHNLKEFKRVKDLKVKDWIKTN